MNTLDLLLPGRVTSGFSLISLSWGIRQQFFDLLVRILNYVLQADLHTGGPMHSPGWPMWLHKTWLSLIGESEQFVRSRGLLKETSGKYLSPFTLSIFSYLIYSKPKALPSDRCDPSLKRRHITLDLPFAAIIRLCR